MIEVMMRILHRLHSVISKVVDWMLLVFQTWISKPSDMDHVTVVECNKDSEDSCGGVHCLSIWMQWNMQQPPCRLVEKVWIQHSHFTWVSCPDLRRELPKTFSNPFLIVEDLFEPAQVLWFERHQHHECLWLILQSRVGGGRLWVEQPHRGLVPHVLLIASDWGFV